MLDATTVLRSEPYYVNDTLSHHHVINSWYLYCHA